MEGQESGVPHPQPRIHELAIASIVCGGASIMNPFIGWILGIVAIVFWVKARDAIAASKGALTGGGLALAGMICGIASIAYFVLFIPIMVFFIAFPAFISMRTGASEAMVKSNMHILQQTVEQFATEADGYYPATISTTVGQVLQQLGREEDDKSSVADAGRNDPAALHQIDASGNALLPGTYNNPLKDAYDELVLGTWTEGKLAWSCETQGMIWYLPKGTDGAHATGYEIRGVGRQNLLTLVLSSDD